jgi:putative flippase GtrA
MTIHDAAESAEHADQADRPAPSATSRSLPRYLVVGVLSVAIDAGTLAVLHGVLRVWLPLATTLGYALAFAVNFGLNRSWAFGSTAAVGGQATRFLALSAANYLITLAIVTGLAAAGVYYLVAKVISVTVIAAVNYVTYRMWIFR